MKAYIDGYLSINDHKIYYKVFGKASAKKAPLLVLHGGPGSSHNYMLGLAELARDRQVVFYDQLGGGLSDHPKGVKWSFRLYLGELKQVREQLNLTNIHLLGHSWGGMLAIEYLLSQPKGIKSAILASAMISMPLYQREVDKLKQDMPERIYQALIRHEKAGTTDSEEYRLAMTQYDKRHIYRGGVFPKRLSTPQGTFGKEPYETLWGPSEACANGSLKNWDRINQLKKIKPPVLITAGQYDELTPYQAVVTHDAIPGSQLNILTAGSHCAHIEREEDYLQTVADFLSQTS